MARLSRRLLGAVNLVTLLVSLPVVCTGIYFRMRGATDCDRALQLPVIALGCAVLVLSLVGLLGACGRRVATAPFLWAYVVAMFLLTVAVFAFTVFAFVVTTDRAAGSAVPGRGFREYRLGDFSGWLQARIAQPGAWRRVESCLAEARVCGHFDDDSDAAVHAADFYHRQLTPIQSGCCKPPTRCGFQFVNATVWEKPRSRMRAAAARDVDCHAWSNDQQTLCFRCDACKAGVLATVNKKWKVVSIFNVVVLAVLIVVYTLGCCALRSGGKAGGRYGSGCDET